jgi:hypothetical protein
MSSLLASPGETSELDQARRLSKDQEAATGDENGGAISADDPAILSNVAGPSKQRTGSSRIPLDKRNTSKAGRPSPGIIYISRLPPGMTPQKVKHLMSSYGDIGRVYAQRSDGKLYSLRLGSRAIFTRYLTGLGHSLCGICLETAIQKTSIR